MRSLFLVRLTKTSVYPWEYIVPCEHQDRRWWISISHRKSNPSESHRHICYRIEYLHLRVRMEEGIISSMGLTRWCWYTWYCLSLSKLPAALTGMSKGEAEIFRLYDIDVGPFKRAQHGNRFETGAFELRLFLLHCGKQKADTYNVYNTFVFSWKEEGWGSWCVGRIHRPHKGHWTGKLVYDRKFHACCYVIISVQFTGSVDINLDILICLKFPLLLISISILNFKIQCLGASMYMMGLMMVTFDFLLRHSQWARMVKEKKFNNTSWLRRKHCISVDEISDKVHHSNFIQELFIWPKMYI